MGDSPRDIPTGSSLKQHPAAQSFPLMDARRFAELVDDIQDHGQRVRIIMCGDQVLDGRNRWLACEYLDIEPLTEEFTSGDPWAYVWSLNGSRRDLNADQRYLIWRHCNQGSATWKEKQADIAASANAKRSKATKEQPRTDGGKKLAAKNQVVVQTVQPPDRDIDRKAKAAAAQVNKGAVARGDSLATHRPDLADKVRLGEMKPAEAQRQMKKDAVSKKIAELPKGKFRVIYADPPWCYTDKCDDGAIQSGGAEKHYPSISTPDVCAMPIPERLAPDAVLFLWVTSPMLPDGLKVMSAWGFKYKASFVWDKIKHNMGHYNSVRHEFLLVGTIGSCTPDNVKLFDSVQTIERTGHSEKPDQFRDIIETLYTHGSKLELFGRKPAKGWKVFGNEL